MTHFRGRWHKGGAHVHVEVYSARIETQTHARNGELVFHQDEWESFLRCFNDHGDDRVTVVPKDGQP